jgi:predicted transcriptional regulator of viral defense system
MQPNIAKHVLADLTRRGWTGGKVVRVRSGVYAIVITTPTGDVCQFQTVDEVRLQVRLISG